MSETLFKKIKPNGTHQLEQKYTVLLLFPSEKVGQLNVL